jgi:phosphoserine phosphatase
MSSFSSFHAMLSQTQWGCGWTPNSGFSPLSSYQHSEYRLIVIGQLVSEASLTAILYDVQALLNPVYIKPNDYNEYTSCYGVDIGVDLQVDSSVVKAKLMELSDKYLLDFVLQKPLVKLSEPGLLVMDMDSTMIQMECIDEIARLAGRYEDVAAVTAEAMNGGLEFAESLKTRVACLKGVQVSALEEIKTKLPLMPGLFSLIKTLKANQWKIAVASGGFTYFADYLKEWLELDYAISNVLEIHNGCLTGQTTGEVIDANAKARTLDTLKTQWHISDSQTCAIGDGANDLTMLAASTMGVAFHAKHSVKARADCAVTYQPLDAFLLLLA